MNMLLKEIDSRGREHWNDLSTDSKVSWLEYCNLSAHDYATNWDDLNDEVRHILATEYSDFCNDKARDLGRDEFMASNPNADIHADY